MIFYAVIDTNVIVSSVIKSDSIPGLIVDLAIKGNIVMLFNDDIVKEYRDVLSRKKFDFNQIMIKSLLNSLIKSGMLYGSEVVDRDFIDENDKKFYELYYSFKKENNVFLITGNKKHFPNENNIVSPREFLEIIGDK